MRLTSARCVNVGERDHPRSARLAAARWVQQGGRPAHSNAVFPSRCAVHRRPQAVPCSKAYPAAVSHWVCQRSASSAARSRRRRRCCCCTHAQALTCMHKTPARVCALALRTRTRNTHTQTQHAHKKQHTRMRAALSAAHPAVSCGVRRVCDDEGDGADSFPQPLVVGKDAPLPRACSRKCLPECARLIFSVSLQFQPMS